MYLAVGGTTVKINKNRQYHKNYTVTNSLTETTSIQSPSPFGCKRCDCLRKIAAAVS